jgi:hypothetical protein
MANNIVALNLNGNEYAFRPLYIVDGYGSLNNDAISLGYFSMVDEASLLVYLSGKDSDMDSLSVQFEVNNDSMTIFANYHGRELCWGDLREDQVYEFVFFEGTFYLTGDIPKTSIKYRDNKNQLQTLVIGENTDIDLSGGVYYATTSSTATRVANSLILTNADGEVCEYNGSRSFDLSAGVNYAVEAGHATDANWASTADSAGRLMEYMDLIPGQHAAGEYCHIGSVDVYGVERGNCSILFTGHGYNDFQYAPWSGILYFEWHNNTANSILGSAKWMCLTRSDLSNKILLTIETVDSTHKLLHVYFAYPNPYASADVTLIKGANLIFDTYTRASLIGSTIATSTFDGGGSGSFGYKILDNSGAIVEGKSMDLGNEAFIFRPGPNIIIEPSRALNSTHASGITIQLSNEFTQAFVQLQQYTQILQHTVANQQQQIADLKSVLTEITTGKTWDDGIWGETAGQGATSGITTDEYGHIDIHPL